MAESSLVAASPWRDIALSGRFGRPDGEPGLIVEPVEGMTIRHYAAARGAGTAAEAWAASALGGPWPAAGRSRRIGQRLILWNGPARWLLLDSGPDDGEDILASTFPGLVCDQSHALALLRLSGAACRDVLAKGCMLDLHPDAFADGETALTAIAHINLQLWREADRWMLAVPRSFAASFWHWLEASALEFGLDVKG